MVKIFRSHKISFDTKRRILTFYIRPVLLYGSKCWTVSPAMHKKLEATEIQFNRSILRISYTEHITNEEVLRRMSTRRQLIFVIRTQQMRFFGHILRHKEIETIVATGKVEGKRSRGRQRLTYCKSLSNWIGISEVEMTRAARERKEWSAMISQVWTRRGT